MKDDVTPRKGKLETLNLHVGGRRSSLKKKKSRTRTFTPFSLFLFSGAYQPSHDLKLRFYAYFKQATEGPCNASKPAFWDVVGKLKWEAWKKLGNMPKHEAMNNYVEELKKVRFSFSFFWPVNF